MSPLLSKSIILKYFKWLRKEVNTGLATGEKNCSIHLRKGPKCLCGCNQHQNYMKGECCINPSTLLKELQSINNSPLMYWLRTWGSNMSDEDLVDCEQVGEGAGDEDKVGEVNEVV